MNPLKFNLNLFTYQDAGGGVRGGAGGVVEGGVPGQITWIINSGSCGCHKGKTPPTVQGSWTKMVKETVT